VVVAAIEKKKERSADRAKKDSVLKGQKMMV
jgi:hypothetical protein